MPPAVEAQSLNHWMDIFPSHQLSFSLFSSWKKILFVTPKMELSEKYPDPMSQNEYHSVSAFHSSVWMWWICYECDENSCSLNMMVIGIPRGAVVKTCLSMQEMQEMQVQFMGQEDPLEEEMATHSSILAWRIPMDRGAWWVPSTGLQRVGHDWVCMQAHARDN